MLSDEGVVRHLKARGTGETTSRAVQGGFTSISVGWRVILLSGSNHSESRIPDSRVTYWDTSQPYLSHICRRNVQAHSKEVHVS